MRTLLLLTLLSPAARAAYPRLTVYESGLSAFGLQLGVAKPLRTAGFDARARSGPAVNLEYWRLPWDWIGLGAEAGYNKFNKNARGSASALNAGLLARVHLVRERSWTPYALGGVGKHWLSIGDGGVKASSMSLSAGGGVEAFVIRGLTVAFEARWRRYRHGDAAAEALNYYVGVRWWLAR